MLDEEAGRWWRTSTRDLYPEWKGPRPSGECVPGHGGWCTSHVPCASTRTQIERSIDLDAMRPQPSRRKSLGELSLAQAAHLWNKARSLCADVRLQMRLKWVAAGFLLGYLAARVVL